MGGFLGLPMLSALAPFAILPIISRITGDGFGAVGAGQNIGVLACIVAMVGWGIYGPAAVAQAPAGAAQQRIYHDSLVVRAVALAVVLPISLVLTWIVVEPAWRADSMLMAAAFAAPAMGPGWYLIGQGRPALLAAYDIIPRFVATVLAVPLVLATNLIWPYAALNLAAIAGATYVFSRRELHGFDAASLPHRSLAARVRQTAAAAGVDTATNVFGTLPVPIANAALSPADNTAFSAVDRVFRVGVTVVANALGNVFQAWVLDRTAPDARRRQWLAIVAHAVVGVAGLAVLAGLGPWLTRFVFGARAVAERAPSLWYGVAFLFLSLATPLIRNLLIPAGRTRWVLFATVVSSVVGLAGMGVGAALTDGAVIAAGFALSQVLLFGLLVRPALARMPAPAPHRTEPA